MPKVTYCPTNNLLCITPPPLKERARINLVAVVDCSGSMSTAVSTSTEVTHGFTTLNLVNHGVQTLISSLNPEIDQFGLVSFDSSAIVEFPLAYLNTSSNMARAKVVTDALKPRGTTKIWLGLLAALEMLMAYEKKAVAAEMVVRGWPIIILQTDGVDDDGANANFAANLLTWRQRNPMKQQPLIFTTGFGINSESEKLAALADAGDGLYAYIHNAGSVGTVFVNALANMFSLLGTRLTLHVADEPSPTSLAFVGPLLFGQTKYIKVASNPLESLSLSYEGMDGKRITIKVQAQKGVSIGKRELARQDVVTTFKQALWQLVKKADTVAANMVLKGLADRLDLAGASVNPELEALLDDTAEARNAVLHVLNGSWGGPHLRSIIAAHEKQVCLDFKNPGLQLYSSVNRNTMVESINEVFNSLPPPTASLQAQHTYSYSAPVSMAAYNSADDPCVHGKSVTILADGTTVRADQLKKGDVLHSNGATIICVVKTLTIDGYASLVQVPKSNLCITPYHPIRGVNPPQPPNIPGCGEWLFPQETASPVYLPCVALYSFILSSGHTIFFDGIETVTLGHGFSDNAVVQHPYLGYKNKVVADLARMPGYADQGLLTFQSGCLKRDPVIGIVNGFDETKLL